jgi:excisionase family DNA binding protein
METQTETKYYTQEEVAQYLNVHLQTVGNWILFEKIKYEYIDHKKRISSEEIARIKHYVDNKLRVPFLDPKRNKKLKKKMY